MSTKPITIYWDNDAERPWFEPRDPSHDTHEDPYLIPAEIPTEVWERWQAALTEIDAAEKAVCDAAGYDRELGQLGEVCDEWHGTEQPPHRWYSIILKASGSEDVWPVINATITSRKTRDEAEQWIASLPDQIRIVHPHGGDGVQEIRRDDLYIEEGGFAGYSSACGRCGHERDVHHAPDTQETP